ncbi:MAG: LapA family protein [Campylobacter sp.]|nr:LapA family protein [Campylobacter sp.]
MKTKQFFVYSVIYIGIIAAVIFTQESASYTLSLLGHSLTLPVAVWVVLPLALYMLLALCHLGFYGFMVYRKNRAIQKDVSSYDEMTKEVLLGLETNRNFKTEFFKDPSDITKILSPWYDSSELDIKNESLKEIVDVVEKVKNGEVVDLKKYKLPKSNGMFLQNELNRLDAEPDYAREILKTKGVYNDQITKKAYKILVDKGDYSAIKTYNEFQDSDDIKRIVERATDESEFEVSSEELFNLINSDKFSDKDFIYFAKKLKDHLNPEQYRTFFERLKNQNSSATEAYLYALYELGMIDELREQLHMSDGDEFDKFQILLFLRDNGKSVPASLIF